ncbi:hypothetical protein QR680_002032 [Steinernema hermaphroditum]|uniref:Phorbol-ester/DAG-type domain-containing protein n=1 Tax=Steinernema hermaphroditum TaxID=289476 RepID=A0AA39H113_9BILA|nr:hypothetical protein QR680_002032 [Steinernema hermaphroditum]
MDGITWLLITWLFVGALCYFAVNKMGNAGPESDANIQKQNAPSVATSSPENVSKSSNCDWANEIISWLFQYLRRVPEPLEAWIKSLNDAAKKVAHTNNCEVLFEGFGDHSDIHKPPKLSNVVVEQGPRDHLTLRAHIDLPEVRVKLVTSQRTSDHLSVSNYDAYIRDLHGEVEGRIACIANQLFFMGCFNGRPEMDIQLVNRDSNQINQVSTAFVEETIRRCLVSAVTNINLSETTVAPGGSLVEVSKSSVVTAPVHEIVRRLHQSHLVDHNTTANVPPNKVRVKVIRAQRLGVNKDVHQPYVVIEMDEPAKKYTTSTGLNVSPYWEEDFEFDITPASEEILFEVYEGLNQGNNEDDKNFLGLAIVGFDELRQSKERVHSLELQGRPYRNDHVSGSLTVEFELFYDPNVETIGKQIDQMLITNHDGKQFTETITTSKRPIYDPHDSYEQHDIVPSSTTTVLVKTVSQQTRDKPLISSVHGSMENAMDPVVDRALHDAFLHQQHNEPFVDEHSTLLQYENDRTTLQVEEVDSERKSRDRSKKTHETTEKRDRSFFGDLKDRLSGRRRSKRRAKSADVGNPELEEAVSLPPSRDQSQTRYSTRGTSYYETSSVGGKSRESTKSLYSHSTLILEMNTRNNEKKYYEIPKTIIAEPAAVKLMRRGKKLHLHNDHTFVAVKIRGGTVCNICHQRIARSFAKQAYQCRDCRLVCHKSCHYKSVSPCAQSSIAKLNIIRDIDWVHFLSHSQLEEYISAEGV